MRLGQHVAVRTERHAVGDRDPGVVGFDAGGEIAPVEDLTAVGAEDAAHGAVQFDDPAAAGAHVQAVDVLRDDAGRDAAGLEVGERAVAGVGLRGREGPPAEMAAHPVPTAGVLVGEELSGGHRRAGGRALAAVVRDAGVGRHAGAGEDRDAAPRKDVQRLIDGGGGRRVELGHCRHGSAPGQRVAQRLFRHVTNAVEEWTRADRTGGDGG